jgi:hypothetical protein
MPRFTASRGVRRYLLPHPLAKDPPVNGRTTQAAPHAHHWRIDEAQGPTSNARCKLCGEEREFRNSLSEMDFLTRIDREYAA